MKRSALAFAIYCGMTIALTYPLVLKMGSVLPNDPGDPALNTWILWWNTQAVPLTSKWWNAPAFFPAPGVLSFSENLLGLSLLSAPLMWLGFDPQTAYNVVFLLTFPLSAVGAYLLVFELTRRHDAAFVAGMLFGFAPYRIAHLPQIQSLASFPMPFAVLGLHRYLGEPRPRWLVLFSAGWLLQGLCNGYYLLFFSVFVGLWILWFAAPWSRPRQFLAIVTAWGIAVLAMLPLLLRYRTTHASFGFARNVDAISEFSADLAALLHATDHLAFWGSLHVFRRPEGELFPGLTLALLVTAALFVRGAEQPRVRSWILARRVLIVLTAVTALVAFSAIVTGPLRFEPFGIRVLSVSNPIRPLTCALALGLGLALTSGGLRRAYAARSVVAFYAVAAFVTWLFSLGPAPTLMGKSLIFGGPYALLMSLPGFNSLRVPARFWMMTTLCLAVVGAIVFDRLAARLGRMRTAAATLVVLGALADAWMSAMPLADTPKPFRALDCGGETRSPLVELPLGTTDPDVAAMYRQMSHQRPVVNGYSGYFPPHYGALRFGLTMREPDMLEALASRGVTDVIVDRSRDRGGKWDEYVQSHPSARHVCTDGDQSLYRLTPVAAGEAPAGSRLPAAVIRANVNEGAIANMVDNDRTTRWESGPQSTQTRIEIDLGGVRSVAGIDLMLGPSLADFPRGLLVEVSEDRLSWRKVWEGGSAGLAFAGASEAPLDVPLRYRFPATPARLVRMQLTKNDHTYYWSIAEMRIVGP
jgi:hypothetical protein